MENKSSFLKDAIESITTLANKAKEPKTLEYNSHLYLIDEGGNANRIWEPKDTPQRKRVCSLDALVALIKHEAVDRYATNAHPPLCKLREFRQRNLLPQPRFRQLREPRHPVRSSRHRRAGLP